MSAISTFKIKKCYEPFLSVLLGFLVVFVLFGGVLSKSALAYVPSNNYVDSLTFKKSPDGYGILGFHCKTSFTLATSSADRIIYLMPNQYPFLLTCDGSGCNSSIFPNLVNDGFVAGNTYSIKGDVLAYAGVVYLYEGSSGGIGRPFNSDDGLGMSEFFFPNPVAPYNNWVGIAYFQETPIVYVAYPFDYAELTTNFYITGDFTQPAGSSTSTSHFLQVDSMPAGTYSSSLRSFYTAIYGETSGPFSIFVSGLSAGYYDFRIYFRTGDWDFYQGALIQNIHIVNDLPFELPPTQGQPPTEVPQVYQELVCGTYYTENSTYDTSTALFNNICLTLSPMLLAIGGNLTQYASNFTPSNASSTGNQMGGAVALLRSYLSNLNSFFDNFPVSQFLYLYLLALLVVIIIRLVKGLIHVSKPV